MGGGRARGVLAWCLWALLLRGGSGEQRLRPPDPKVVHSGRQPKSMVEFRHHRNVGEDMAEDGAGAVYDEAVHQALEKVGRLSPTVRNFVQGDMTIDTMIYPQWHPWTLLSAVIWCVFIGLVGAFYYNEKMHPPRLDNEGTNVAVHIPGRLDKQRWRFGLFECCGDPAVCFLAFACPAIRWADTLRMAHFIKYQTALTIFILIIFLNVATVGFSFLILVLLGVFFRQKIREKFNIPHGDGITIAEDLCIHSFCCCCAITQEARQLEEAYLSRHRAVEPGPPFKR